MEENRHNRIQAKMHTQEEWESIELAAEILEGKKGFTCFAKIIKSKADKPKDIKKSSDMGDILLYNRSTKEVKIVEIKRLSEDNFLSHFTSRETWLNDDFIVDGVYQFDHKNPIPFMYMCFNADLTAVAILYTRTYKNWKIRETKGNESTKKYYVADLNDVKFYIVKDLTTQGELIK